MALGELQVHKTLRFSTSARRGTFRVATAAGSLPSSDAEALDVINSMLPSGSPPLRAEDVFVHRCEAASSRFISDRFLFLGDSTLRNIAADAANGVSFMNSHRSGSLFTPAELPLGRTYAGRYEVGQDDAGSAVRRAVVAFFMLKGVRPNGDSGPSTDDVDKLIRGGQLTDVSVGLSGGDYRCDVCGLPLLDGDCGHRPGMVLGMSSKERAGQNKRGVPKGAATATLEGAHLAEVSAVFAAAVPGAAIFSHGADAAVDDGVRAAFNRLTSSVAPSSVPASHARAAVITRSLVRSPGAMRALARAQRVADVTPERVAELMEASPLGREITRRRADR